jgi:2-desacetyl-2-hydroxyethyl bacteriochlorophyllide A dehydrogenase
MPQEARAFWITAPGRSEIRSESLREPGDRDIVVRTLFSAISRGTEALVYGGHVPESEWNRMRAPFQEGSFPAPVKYGYASVGVVEHGPSQLQDRHVFVLYPHQTRYVVPAEAAYVLPDTVPPSRAVLAANLETALNGLWDARPHVGDRIAVIGAGSVGCLAAWVAAQIPGCMVELVDLNPRREAIASALGVPFTTPSAATRDADLVIHASGSPAGLDLALRLAAFESTIVELSWFGDQPVPLSLGGAFHARRLTIASSHVGTVASSQRSRWDTRRRMQLALSLVAHSELDALISGESAFEALPDVMRDLAAAPGDALCHRIRYS